MSEWCVLEGDCLAVLQTCPDNYFDSMVTDPPAGVAFMNRSWDSDKGGRDQWIAWLQGVMAEVKRTLKPGAHCLVWALPRTSHWTATALENAGFEVRDVITHHFGSGFPKSQDVSKFVDRELGAVGTYGAPKSSAHAGWIDRGRMRGDEGHEGYQRPWMEDPEQVGKNARLYIPGASEAQAWTGFGTALKPATEHWLLARKPLAESSIARNVLAHGVGALNIDGCRVNRASDDVPGWHQSGADGSKGFHPEACCHCSGTGKARFYSDGEPYTDGPEVDCAFCLGSGMTKQTFAIRPMSAEEIQERCGGKGRWPANLLLSHEDNCTLDGCVPSCPVAELDRQSGVSTGTGGKSSGRTALGQGSGWNSHNNRVTEISRHNDTGGASRFFPTFRYQAKPSRGEKEAGLNDLPDATLNRVNPGGLEHEPRFAPIQVKNNHPTVKGIELCKWLCRLITPPGGRVLDPFAGSGSIGCAAVTEGFNYVGIEQDSSYCEIARARIKHWAGKE